MNEEEITNKLIMIMKKQSRKTSYDELHHNIMFLIWDLIGEEALEELNI